MSEDYGLIWVCQCCILVLANGECCDNEEHGGDGIEPLSAVEESYSVTPGMGSEDHDESCLYSVIANAKSEYPMVEWPDVPGNYECECETDTFSTSQCWGCGSYLHGERHAAHLWKD